MSTICSIDSAGPAAAARLLTAMSPNSGDAEEPAAGRCFGGELVAYVQVRVNGFFSRHRRSATMHNVLGLGAVSISLAWTILLEAFDEL
jgi:hypothetical protein